jgi:WD40 repeat protein
LLACSSSGPTGLWDVATGRSIGPDFGWSARIYSAAFHPGGRFVATGDHKGSIRFWPVPEPVRGDVARLRLWVQVLTALADDPVAGGLELNPKEWADKKRLLDELGWPAVQ